MVRHVADNLPLHLVPQLPDSMCDARIQDEIEIARTHPSFVTNVLKSYKDLGHVGDNVVELSVRIMIVMAADSRLPRTHFRTVSVVSVQR